MCKTFNKLIKILIFNQFFCGSVFHIIKRVPSFNQFLLFVNQFNLKCLRSVLIQNSNSITKHLFLAKILYKSIKFLIKAFPVLAHPLIIHVNKRLIFQTILKITDKLIFYLLLSPFKPLLIAF